MEFVEFKNRKYFVPEIFSDKINASYSFSVYQGHEVKNTGKIIKELRSGRLILTENTERQTADGLYSTVLRRVDELILFEDSCRIRSKNFPGSRKSEFGNLKNDILNRVLVIAEGDNIISFNDEKTAVRNLISFCGNEIYDYNGESYLIPYKFLKELEEKLKLTVTVNSVGADISAGIDSYG